MEIPPPYDEFLIGRIVEHPEEEGLMGFVKYAPSIRIGEHDAEVEAEEGIQISYKFLVKWDDGTEEDMEDDDVQKIATQEFIKEEWVSERILALQECGWDEVEADIYMDEQKNAKAKAEKAATAAASKSTKAASKSKPSAPRNPREGLLRKGSSGPISMSFAELKRLHSQGGKAGATTNGAGPSKPTAPCPSPAKKPAPKQRQQQQQKADKVKPATKKRKADEVEPEVVEVEEEESSSLSTGLSSAPPSTVNPSRVQKSATTTTAATKRPAPATKKPVSKAATTTESSPPKRGRQAGSGLGGLGADADAAASPAKKKKTTTTTSTITTNGDLTHKRVLNPKYPRLHTEDLSVRMELGKTVYEYDVLEHEGVKYRIYSASLIIAEDKCFSKGRDLTIKDWKIKEKYAASEDDEYVVEAFVADKQISSKKFYLIKYQGFELDLDDECWMIQKEANELEPLDLWLKGGKSQWEMTSIEIRRTYRHVTPLKNNNSYN